MALVCRTHHLSRGTALAVHLWPRASSAWCRWHRSAVKDGSGHPGSCHCGRRHKSYHGYFEWPYGVAGPVIAQETALQMSIRACSSASPLNWSASPSSPEATLASQDVGAAPQAPEALEVEVLSSDATVTKASEYAPRGFSTSEERQPEMQNDSCERLRLDSAGSAATFAKSFPPVETEADGGRDASVCSSSWNWTGDGESRKGSDDGATHASSSRLCQQSGQSRHWVDVHKVDPFARGRVLNFVRRMGSSDGAVFHVRALNDGLWENATHPAHGASPQVQGLATPTLYVATCRLPLPEPHRLRIAEGVAETKKEAELLAAMHAERVCDALGVPLFQLRRAQQKHAEAVRREEGRYAPFPDDPILPLGTAVPPPLRLLRSPAAARMASGTPPSPTPQPLSADGATAQGMACEVATAQSPAALPHHPCETAKARPFDRSPKGSEGDRPVPVPFGTDGKPIAGGACMPGDAASRAGHKDCVTITLRRHDPFQDYLHKIPHYTDAEHAERVRTYTSTVFYPWVSTLEGSASIEADWNNMQRSEGSGKGVGATALHRRNTMAMLQYDPTENGMWRMVNDRNLRRSPTPDEALVLPFVYDGDYAAARLREYYAQHGTTLEKHLTLHPMTGHAEGKQRMMVAELSLVGLPVTAKGKAQTEEMAIRLAAMHAELLLDALGQPLFPQDPQRQARHAEAVGGYGRWAPNPVTGATTPPNPYDALPLPLKSQIGLDDVWLGKEARPYTQHRWSESEHIISALNFIDLQSEDELEVHPPVELCEEAVVLLREWQTHIARNRFTNLFVLFDRESEYRATTFTPVPPEFGLRGGTGVGPTREVAVQMSALHAMDTLCLLGVPLCVDAARERRYLQRRAALGLALPGTLAPSPLPWGCKGDNAALGVPGQPEGDSGFSRPGVTAVPYLPMYKFEGSQHRLIPRLADSFHAMQLHIPDDFCLFQTESEAAGTELGNFARTSVQNYLEVHLTTAMRAYNLHFMTERHADPVSPAPSPMMKTAEATATMEKGGETEASRSNAGGSRMTLDARAMKFDTPEEVVADTQSWARPYAAYTNPFAFNKAGTKQENGYFVCYLPLPLPGTEEAAALMQAAEGVSDDGHNSCTPSSSAGPPYVLAFGVSLKRRDAERACFLHAASLLHLMGVDVLEQYPRGLPKVRQVSTFSDLALYLGKEKVVVIPYRGVVEQRGAAVVGGVAPVHDVASGTVPEEVNTEHHSASSSSSFPPVRVRTESAPGAAACPATVPCSVHPPRPVLHMNLKLFLESSRNTTSLKKRDLTVSTRDRFL